MADPDPRANDDLEQDDTLSNPLRVQGVLHNLQKHRTQLRVVIRGSVRDAISMVLQVNDDDGSFLIDELVPRSAHEQAMAGAPFSIFARHGGAQVIMRGLQVEQAGERDGVAFYKLRAPATMRYIQRRRAFRVEVPQSLGASVQLANDHHPARIGGTLADLSGTGCRLLIDHLPEPAIEVDERFPLCAIEVPGRQRLELEASTRFVAWNKTDGHLDLGLEFDDVSRAQDRALWSLVNALQRRLRKIEIAEAEARRES